MIYVSYVICINSVTLDMCCQDSTKGASTVIEYGGEMYLTVTEVARRFNISRGTCYSNILKHVQACYLPGRRNALYRQSDVERFSEVRIIVACQQGVSIAAKQTAHPA
jgi:hypothetical protein